MFFVILFVLTLSPMKNSKRLYFQLILLLFGLSLSAQEAAQEAAQGKVGGIEIGAGVNFFGPPSRMSALMEQYGFDDDILDWVYETAEEYPAYFPMGLSFRFSYARKLKEQNQVGVALQYSGFSKVQGYSEIYGDLDVRFSSIYVAPMYTRILTDFFEIQAGIPILVNIGRKTSLYDENVDESMDSYVKLSAGILAGFNFKLWDGMNTYGKIGAQYILAIPNKMGPYTAYYGFGETQSIPESKIGFSHMNVLFTMGFHLWRLHP